MSKKQVLGFTLGVIATTLAGCSNSNSLCKGYEVRTEILIERPLNKVYSALTEFDKYPQWNPYHVEVSGELKVGSKLEVNIRRPDGKEISLPPHLMVLDENREVTWGGGVKGIFYGEHRFILERVNESTTRLHHNEDFSGCAVYFADLPIEIIEQGYREMNVALKQYLESEG